MLFADIFIIEKSGKYKGDVINRAYVLGEILEKYPEINVTLCKDKRGYISFKLKKGKKVLSIILITGSIMEYKVGRKSTQGVFYNRRIILPLLEELNNDKIVDRRGK